MILAAVNPTPTGTLAAFRVLNAGVAVNLDLDDLILAITAPLELAVDIDDEVTLVANGTLEPGTHVITVTAASVAAGFDLALEAVTVVAAHPYGARTAAVEALVPNLTLTYTGTPSVADVAGWIDDNANLILTRIGNLDDLIPRFPDDVPIFTARAATIVELLAASWTEDAAHPERIAAQGDSRYAAELERRAIAQLAQLEANVDVARITAGLPPLNEPTRRVAASFPAPQWRRDTDL